MQTSDESTLSPDEAASALRLAGTCFRDQWRNPAHRSALIAWIAIAATTMDSAVQSLSTLASALNEQDEIIDPLIRTVAQDPVASYLTVRSWTPETFVRMSPRVDPVIRAAAQHPWGAYFVITRGWSVLAEEVRHVAVRSVLGDPSAALVLLEQAANERSAPYAEAMDSGIRRLLARAALGVPPYSWDHALQTILLHDDALTSDLRRDIVTAAVDRGDSALITLVRRLGRHRLTQWTSDAETAGVLAEGVLRCSAEAARIVLPSAFESLPVNAVLDLAATLVATKDEAFIATAFAALSDDHWAALAQAEDGRFARWKTSERRRA